MNSNYQRSGGCGSDPIPAGEQQLNQCYAVHTQNTFGPLSEWVGVSMNADNEFGYQEQMDFIASQSKRRRCNTGTNSFSALSLDDKLLHMYEKLNSLEQTNKSIESIANCVTQTSSKVDHMNMRVDNHEQFLKLLAYKSIDIEARSRRRNLLFHGLAENRNENCAALVRDFLWDEMGLDADDFYIERVHRLGSVQRARQRRDDPNQVIRRPIIVSFYEQSNTETVMNSAYMLRGTKFSVTRDFPMEIVNARRNLMAQFIKEKQNRNNKVSIEYPARLTVNGRTVLDEFPDWYSVLQQDRYQLANTLSQPRRPGQAQVPDSIQMQNSQPSHVSNTVFHAQNTMRTVGSSPQVRCDFDTGVSSIGAAQPTNTRTYAQAVRLEPQVSSVGPQGRVGGKKGNRTEPNRTNGLSRTGPTEFSDCCGTRFYLRHQTEPTNAIFTAYFNNYFFSF